MTDTYLDPDTIKTLKQTSFQNTADRDLWQIAFRLNSESSINALSDLVQPQQQPAPSTLNLEPAPLPVVVSPHSDEQKAGPLGPEFASWRQQPQNGTASDQAADPTSEPSPPSAQSRPQAASGQPVAMPSGQPPTQTGGGAQTDEAWARQEARRLGIDPDTAVKVGNSEGGFNQPSRQSDVVYQGNREESYGPYQLNMTGGLGSAALQQGIDARNPAHNRAAITYALEHAAKNGWEAFHGAARVGVGSWDGIGQIPTNTDTNRQNTTPSAAPSNATSRGMVTVQMPNSTSTMQVPSDMVGEGPGQYGESKGWRVVGAPPQAASGTPAAMPTAASSYTQQGLANAGDPDAWAKCGPVAAFQFAQRMGRNPTPVEVEKLAKQSGWTGALGMASFQSEADVLTGMGIASKAEVGVNWDKVVTDVSRGNPVILELPGHEGHYITAQGYDPKTGKIDFGSTVGDLRAAGHKTQFTPSELEGLGWGTPTHSLYLDNPATPAPSVAAGGSAPTAGAPSPADSPSLPPPGGGSLPAAAGAGVSDQPWSPDAPAGNVGPPVSQMSAGRAGGGIMYRQPTAPTMGDTGTGDGTSGSTSGGTLPVPLADQSLPQSGYNDPTAAGTQDQPLPSGPTYNDPTAGGTPDQPLPYSPPASTPAAPLPNMAGRGYGYTRPSPPEPPPGPTYGPDRAINPEQPGTLRPTDLPPDLQGSRPWMPAPQRSGGIQIQPGQLDNIIPRADQTGPVSPREQAPQPSRWSPAVQNAPYQDEQSQPAESPYAPRQEVPTLPGVAGHMISDDIRRAQRSGDLTVNPLVGLQAVYEAPFDVYQRAYHEAVIAADQHLDGTDPLAPFRAMGIQGLPSAEQINPSGRPASVVLAGLLMANVLPDPMAPGVEMAFRGAGRALGAVGRGLESLGGGAERVAASEIPTIAGRTTESGSRLAALTPTQQRDALDNLVRAAADQGVISTARANELLDQTALGYAQSQAREGVAPTGTVTNASSVRDYGPTRPGQLALSDGTTPIDAAGAASPSPGFGEWTQSVASDLADRVQRAGGAVPAAARVLLESARGAVSANAERVVAADARMAEQGSTVAPGVFGTVSGNPADVSRLNPHVIPPDVADTLDFPVRVPTDPAHIRAIEAAGGSVDPELGVDLNLIRMQGPEAAGKPATRASTFYTAGKPGEPSPYAGGEGASVGGSERIEAPTRFRSPMVLDDAPGSSGGFDQGMRMLGPGEHPEVTQAKQAVRDAGDAVTAAYDRSNALFSDEVRARTGMTRPEWNRTPEGAEDSRIIDAALQSQKEAKLRLQDAQARFPTVTSQLIEDGIREARRAGPEGSPERAQALKDLVTKYGGDPNVIDDLVNLRGADHPESAWAIKENILAHNGRANGYDGALTVQTRTAPDHEVMQHPLVKEARTGLIEANARVGDAITRGAVGEERAIADRGLKAATERFWAAQETARAELSQHQITELADFRESHNPTPGGATPDWHEAHKRVADLGEQLDEASSAMDDAERHGSDDAWRSARSQYEYVRHKFDDAVAAREALRASPGYTLRSDIPRRGGETNATAVAGTLPANAASNPDRLAGVNRVLGQGLASTFSGGMSAAAADQLGDPNDPNRQAKAFVAGALIPPLAARGLARLVRGRGAGAEGGALASFGIRPHGSPEGAAGDASRLPFREASPEEFISLRNRSSRGGFLSPISPQDLAGRQAFVSGAEHTGYTGAVVDQAGDIQNVFNVPGANGATVKGSGAETMLTAIDRGGKTLDAFDGYLPDYYHQFGFEEVGRVPFNRDYAPANWDYAKHGEPDVVLMARRGPLEPGDTPDAIRARIAAGHPTWKTPDPAPQFGSWNEAADARERFLADSGGADHPGLDGQNQGVGVGQPPRGVDPGSSPAGGGAGLDPAQEAARANLSPVGRNVMETYARLTPERAAAVTERAANIVTDQLVKMKADPAVVRPIVEATQAAIERKLADTKVVATGLRPGALAAYLREGGLTSKTEAGDLGQIVEITRQQVQAAGKRLKKMPDGSLVAAPYTTEEASHFVRRQALEHDMTVAGNRFPGTSGARDTEAPNTLYAYVTEGQPLIGPNTPTIWGVWNNDTPRVTTAHHQYGLGSHSQDIHAKMPQGLKDLTRSGGPDGAVKDAVVTMDPQDNQPILSQYGRVPVGGGRSIADTSLLVDQSGENAMRAGGLISSMPDPIRQQIARGKLTDPEEISAILVRGGGVRNREYAGFGAAQSANRSESIIVDPNAANLRALHISGPEGILDRHVPNVPNANGGTGMTTLETAQAVRAKIKADTGNDIPIYYTNTSQKGGSKLITDAQHLEGPPLDPPLSPGRRGIVDQYTQSINPKTKQPYTNIGGAVGPTGAAPGASRLGQAVTDTGNAIRGAMTGGVAGAVTDPGSPQGENESDQDYAARRNREYVQRIGAGALIGGAGFAAGGRLMPKGEGGALQMAGPQGTGQGGWSNLPGVKQALQGAKNREAAMVARGVQPLNPLQWTGELVKSVGYSSMIGLRTASVNIMGNVTEPLRAIPREAVRAFTPQVLGGRGHPNEALAWLKGNVKGALNIPSDAKDALLGQGRFTTNPDQPSLSERTINPIAHAAALLPELSGRILSGLPDALFGSIARGAGEEMTATRIANDLGQQGRAGLSVGDHVRQTLSDAKGLLAQAQPPTPERLQAAQDVLKGGQSYANDMTYRNPMGDISKKISKGMGREVPVIGNLTTPFFATPQNMRLRALEQTPLGFGMNTVNRPGTLRTNFDRNYDATVGSVVMAGLVLGPAASGYITGSGPEDIQKRRELEQTGWRANSSLLPGEDGKWYYVPNRQIGNYGQILNAIGEAHDAVAYRKPGADTRAITMDAARRFGKLVQDDPYASGLTELVGNWTDPQQHILGYASSMASRLTPFAADIRDVATSQDPLERQPETGSKVSIPDEIGQRYRQLTGIGRQQLNPKTDITGESVPNSQQGMRAFVPKVSEYKPDPLINELMGKNVDIGAPRDHFTVTAYGADAPDGGIGTREVRFSPAEKAQWQQYRWAALQPVLDLVKDPDFKQQPISIQQKVFRSMVESANRQADGMLHRDLDPVWDQRVQGTPVKQAS